MPRAHAIRALLGDISPRVPRLLNLRQALDSVRVLLAAVMAVVCCCVHASGNEMTEYQLKAAYLYNFVTFTEWPADIGDTLTLCIYGPDPFGADIDKFQGADVNGRTIEVLRSSTV